MRFRKVVTIIFAIVCVAAVASSALAQETKTASANGGPSQPGAEPLSKKRLLKLLTLNDSTQPELIQIVGQKGVDFKASPSDERELHDAGASDELIVAVRANYRDSTSSSAPTQESSGAIVSNADAPPNSQTNQTGPTPSSQAATAPPPAAKKKSFLDKFNETMNKANAVRASQAPSTQTATAPAEPKNTAPLPTATTGTAQAAQSGTDATTPAQPGTDSPSLPAGSGESASPNKPIHRLKIKPTTPVPEPAPAAVSAPRITVTPANPFGLRKTQGKTTVRWDAGTDHPNAEVWVKVDDQVETKVAEQGNGTLQVTLEPDKTYVYTLKDKGQVLATVTVKFPRNDAPRRVGEFAPIPSRDSFKGSNAASNIATKITIDDRVEDETD